MADNWDAFPAAPSDAAAAPAPDPWGGFPKTKNNEETSRQILQKFGMPETWDTVSSGAKAIANGVKSFVTPGPDEGTPEPKTARERGSAAAKSKATPLDAILLGASYGGVGNIPDYIPAAVEGVGSAIKGEGFSKGFHDKWDELQGRVEGVKEKYPGTSLAGEVTGAIASSIGPQMAVRAPTMLGRILQSALVNGTLGGAQGFASGEGLGDRVTKAAEGAQIGTVIGAGGEAGISALGKGAERYLGAAKAPAPGVDPAARIAAADEFNIPLTRGQATGNTGQQAYEEAARHEARGRFAAKAVQGFDDRQKQAIDAAKQSVADGFGGTAAPVPETGNAIAGALKDRASGFRDQAQALYESAANKNASIASDEISKLGRKVADQLESHGVKLDTYGNYPGSQAAMNLLRRVSGFEGAAPVGPDGKIVAQSLEGLEQARKGLLKVQAANPEDGRALKAIRRAFDDWTNDAINKKLFSGDPTALDDLKQARSLWSRYKGITDNDKTDATKVISKIATEDRTGEEVASWLLGTAGAGQAGRSARVAAEIKNHLGATSPEWEALRQAAWTKAVNPTQGQGGNQALAKSIETFTGGPGAPLARQLFTSDEVGTMRRLANVLRDTVTDPRATNPSKTSYGMARLLGGAGVTSGGGAAYWMSGDPHFLAIAAMPLLKSGASLSKGIAATRAAPSALGDVIGQAARTGVAATTDLEAR